MWALIGGFVAAGTLGITEQMLNMVATEYGRRASGRIIDCQNVVDKHQDNKCWCFYANG